ncbi:5'-nucleotidase [hydrothermal vent metagenome]|uniref:5'-nucleotidase n=1 Tax=hydrothermal vent metagenome TaxID=652676 RepID=A0A3B1BER3_9ZZZZ
MNISRKTLLTGIMLPLLLSIGGVANAAARQYSEHNDAQERDPGIREIANLPLHWSDTKHDNKSNPASWVRFKILGFNDFHGHLSSGRKVGGRPVGSAAVLAAYLEAAEAGSKNGAFIVHAGDQVGASPPVSALLQDEPSISFLNMLANDYCEASDEADDNDKSGDDHNRKRMSHDRKIDLQQQKCNVIGTLGNHEFDEGKQEMLRLINGGNYATGPFLQKEYEGAVFPYVSANVIDNATGKPLLKPYVIRRVKGMKVAFIGAVLKQTPTIVTPTGVAGLSFIDEADAINSYIPELHRQGVHAIIVTIHQGTRQRYYGGPTDAQTGTLNGAIADIVNRLDDDVDIVVSGHSHSFTNALIANAHGKKILVVQAFSYGTAFDDIDVAIDPRSHDIVEKSARIVTTYADIGPGLSPDKDVAKMVSKAEALVAPMISKIIGTTTAGISRTANAAGESPLGNLIADAQRRKMATDFSFMNAGGIRADIPAGNVTWGDLFTVQPFGNDLITMNLTGAQIVQLLNQQWAGQPYPRILKISGLSYTWDNARPENDRIVEVRKADGTLLDMAASYSVTVNSFIAAGGDNYTVLTSGTNRVIGSNDLDALIEYISAMPQPFNAVIEGRIKRLN